MRSPLPHRTSRLALVALVLTLAAPATLGQGAVPPSSAPEGAWAWALVGLALCGYGFLQVRRYHPRRCAGCGAPMRRLGEGPKEDYLGPGQRLEETIGSVKHDVWKCSCRPACPGVTVLAYRQWTCGFKICHGCGHRTLMPEITRVCRHCGQVDPAARQQLGLRPRGHHTFFTGFGGGGGGGGPFGGGSSSGGGASGGW